MSRPKVRPWIPVIGADALHVASSRKTGNRRVKVLAEASGERMIVAAIGKKGTVVRLTVKTENLRQPQPDLFAELT